MEPSDCGDKGTSTLGCCEDDWLNTVPTGDQCTSTGDPHIKDFDGKLSHGYRDGDYIMYKGSKLQVDVRHTQANQPNVAGNGAYSLSGPLMGGNRLTVYFQSRRLGIPNTVAYWNGRPATFEAICENLKDIVCSCAFNPKGNFNLRWSGKWNFKTTGTNPDFGWRNLYLYTDPEHVKDSDDGFCMDVADDHHFKTNPYPGNRLNCGNTPFVKYNKNKYCKHNRRLEPVRRREETVLAACDEALKTAARNKCSSCGDDEGFLQSCMVDACAVNDVEAANDVNTGCFQATLASTSPNERTNLCPSSEVYSEVAGECVTPEAPDTCVYDQCKGGIEVKGAGLAAVNGMYKAAYASCGEIPKYGNAVLGVTTSVWKKEGDDKASIQWYWATNALRGWVVSYDGEIRYYDDQNRKSPAVFVDGEYSTRPDGGFASDPAATVTCVGDPTPPPTPAPKFECEDYLKRRAVCPTDVCNFVKRVGCKTKEDAPKEFTAAEFCGNITTKKICTKYKSTCKFILLGKKCIAKEDDVCANYGSGPQCIRKAKCVNNVACKWDPKEKKCNDGDYCT